MGVGSVEVEEEGTEEVEGKGQEKLNGPVIGWGVGGECCGIAEVEGIGVGSSCEVVGAGGVGSSSISASDESAAKASCRAFVSPISAVVYERERERDTYIYPINDL